MYSKRSKQQNTHAQNAHSKHQLGVCLCTTVAIDSVCRSPRLKLKKIEPAEIENRTSRDLQRDNTCPGRQSDNSSSRTTGITILLPYVIQLRLYRCDSLDKALNFKVVQNPAPVFENPRFPRLLKAIYTWKCFLNAALTLNLGNCIESRCD